MLATSRFLRGGHKKLLLAGGSFVIVASLALAIAAYVDDSGGSTSEYIAAGDRVCVGVERRIQEDIAKLPSAIAGDPVRQRSAVHTIVVRELNRQADMIEGLQVPAQQQSGAAAYIREFRQTLDAFEGAGPSALLVPSDTPVDNEDSFARALQLGRDLGFRRCG